MPEAVLGAGWGGRCHCFPHHTQPHASAFLMEVQRATGHIKHVHPQITGMGP